ncbi:Non-LTR (Long terminal repeat) retrotransposon and domain-containing protein [Elysia marginata]|uniref:Non-LTR (Long terminal repeat) retrotransposon and domain-containing protein n=1 Tax=Elysia marginata TaxID=1093978 RepID=A0AAV4FK89_9GAST|nr:Non-LTR (Long terminal repeat) retrotransposon and domain-containing protein [Elysia marginata]
MSLITQYKKERQSADSEDSSLLDKLNEFYARFDRENTSTPVPLPCDNHDPPFLVTEQETRRALTRLDMNKAAGPDNIKPRLLKTATSWHQSSPLSSIGLSQHQPYRCVSNSQQSYRCRRNLPQKH